MESEEWRDVVGYEGLYQVSSLGRVKSKRGVLTPWRSGASGHYYYIRLQRKIVSLSRTVALTFIPNPENKPEVDHINRNNTDNRAANLRWVSNNEQALNRNMPIPPSGNRCILLTKSDTFEVRIRRDGSIVFNKNFKTLEEAIRARDDFLASK